MGGGFPCPKEAIPPVVPGSNYKLVKQGEWFVNPEAKAAGGGGGPAKKKGPAMDGWPNFYKHPNTKPKGKMKAFHWKFLKTKKIPKTCPFWLEINTEEIKFDGEEFEQLFGVPPKKKK